MKHSLKIVVDYLSKKGTLTSEDLFWIKKNENVILELFFLTKDYKKFNSKSLKNFKKKRKKYKLIKPVKLCRSYLSMNSNN